jgi:hypothetical protein
LSEWEAYDRLDPIGKWRDDFRMSFLASLITNLMIRAYGKKGARLTEVKDFLLDWSGDLKKAGQTKQSPEEMKEILTSIFTAHNKKFEAKSKIKPPKQERK